MVFDITKIARKNILTLEPYRCARDDFKVGLLLDANENTMGPSFSDITSNEESLELNRYPDPHQLVLKQQICDFRNAEAMTAGAEVSIDSEKEGIQVENLCLGVGSDESIDALIRCCVKPSVEKMLICPPTYGMYSICAVVNDVEIVKVPLNLETFQIQPELIIDAISKDSDIKLVYITSPGNPTGAKIDLGLLNQLLAKIEEISWAGLLILDEAYIDFSPVGSSCAVLVNKHPNLVVLQTLSKSFGLAGIRLGITFANTEVTGLLNAMKYPYNISNLTSDVAIRATKPAAVSAMREKCAFISEQRTFVLTELQKLKGIGRNVGGLDSNFLLLEIQDKDGKASNEVANKLYLKLATERNVVVRFRGKELGCEGCLRITIGSPEENKLLVKEFASVLEELLQ